MLRIIKGLVVAAIPFFFMTSCKIVETEFLFSNDETVPLPDKFVIIDPSENKGEVEVEISPVASRVSSNQYEFDSAIYTFEKLASDSRFWIVQRSIKDGKFELYLAEISEDKIKVYMPSSTFSLVGVAMPNFPQGIDEITSRNQVQPYFSMIAALEESELTEIPFYIFDSTQADPEGALLGEYVAKVKAQAEAELAEKRRAKEAEREVIDEARRQEEQRLAEENRLKEQRDAERLLQQRRERDLLLRRQNESVSDKEKKLISFSDGTHISFCISNSTIMSSIKAASEQSYFTFINRLGSLNKERLCTTRLSMKNIEEITVAVEFWEEDSETGRIFMIGSIARNHFSKCPPCDKLRASDRLHFVTYNEVGGDQFGWKGYEQYIVENRTVGGIMDFLLKE
jgi:hypothetical protein